MPSGATFFQAHGVKSTVPWTHNLGKLGSAFVSGRIRRTAWQPRALVISRTEKCRSTSRAKEGRSFEFHLARVQDDKRYKRD